MPACVQRQGAQIYSMLLTEELKDPAVFKEFYMYCFDYSKEQEQHKYLGANGCV